MFEVELEEKLMTIFGVKKVSFAEPGESKEQECLFVQVENALNCIKDGRAISKVTGNAVLFGNADKIPFGFFSKRITQSDPSHTKDLFFFDIEANTLIYQNIIQRGFSFVYFYSAQYDPEQGTITSVDITVEES